MAHHQYSGISAQNPPMNLHRGLGGVIGANAPVTVCRYSDYSIYSNTIRILFISCLFSDSIASPKATVQKLFRLFTLFEYYSIQIPFNTTRFHSLPPFSILWRVRSTHRPQFACVLGLLITCFPVVPFSGFDHVPLTSHPLG